MDWLECTDKEGNKQLIDPETVDFADIKKYRFYEKDGNFHTEVIFSCSFKPHWRCKIG